jgi:hypothetical protein
MMSRSLAVQNDDDLQPYTFQVTLNEDKEYEIRDRQDQQVLNLPTTMQNQKYISQAAETIEHLIKYTLVRDLANMAPEDSFRESFEVYIISRGNRFNSNEVVNVRHEEVLELILENLGDMPLYFSVYTQAGKYRIYSMQATWRSLRHMNDSSRWDEGERASKVRRYHQRFCNDAANAIRFVGIAQTWRGYGKEVCKQNR